MVRKSYLRLKQSDLESDGITQSLYFVVTTLLKTWILSETHLRMLKSLQAEIGKCILGLISMQVQHELKWVTCMHAWALRQSYNYIGYYTLQAKLSIAKEMTASAHAYVCIRQSRSCPAMSLLGATHLNKL